MCGEKRGADLSADDPPTVRMTVFITVATPVSVGRTASVIWSPNFGILHFDWTPKISYAAYRTAAAAG